MLIRAHANACHRVCIHRKLFFVDVKAVLVLGEDHGKSRRALLERLHIDRLVEGSTAMDRMCWRRACIYIVLIWTDLLWTGLNHISEHHRWIGIPAWTSNDAKCAQGAMCAHRRTGDDSFNPSRRRQQYVIAGS